MKRNDLYVKIVSGMILVHSKTVEEFTYKDMYLALFLSLKLN